MSKKKIEQLQEELPLVEKEKPDELQALKAQFELEKKEKEALQAKVDEERELWRKEREEIAQKYTYEATEKVKYQGDSIDSRIEAAKSLSEKLLNDADAAVEKGDFRAANRLNAEYAKTQLQIENLAAQKTTIRQPEQIKHKTASDQWVDAHPLFNEDTRYKAIAVSAHHAAIADGIRVESPEYFRFVESNLDEKYYKKPKFDDADLEEPTEKRMQAIPPSRQGVGDTRDVIRLTPEEAEVAIMTFGQPFRDGTKRSEAECLKMYRDAKRESNKELANRGY